MEPEAYIQRLVDSNPLREPLLRLIVGDLQLPPGSRGLDAGCGVGLQAALLAEAVGPTGHVTGLDLSPDLLRFAEDMVKRRGLSDQITFQMGDIGQLPFEDHCFDWVWSADCVGYPVGDLAPVLREFVRVTRPGASITILAWTAQQILPGYPLLEARLNATCSAFIPYIQASPPEFHFQRALASFRAAGLTDVTARTHVGDVQAPLTEGVRRALALLFEMLWGEPLPGVAPADWAEYQRLCKPESPDFILNLPDYYAFFTYTVFKGRALD